ncbi:MAG: hypothetical protein A2V85_02335 [Chloroflexi bacterium RBG_16_72_14]|nr:MAG: hypothetical protein A2V85_02335 [Chloroflexi bacterium RBG_16_72_14]
MAIGFSSRTWSAPVAPRPAALAAAVVLMFLIGAGSAFVGALLLVLAAGGIAVIPAASVSAFVGLLGVVAILVAAATFSAAVGLWLGRPWGWAASLAIALAAVLGALIALVTAGSQPPVAAGLALTLAAAALLLVPSTRRASGIG